MKQRISKALLERVKVACERNPSIVVPLAELENSLGFGEEHFEWLGLSKADLKKLSRTGLAVRAYTKNIWLPGEIMPNGKVAPGAYAEVPDRVTKEMVSAPTSTMRGSGHRVRWILIAQE